MARLDTQKAPSKKHLRPNTRKMVRGYATMPHDTWGESSTAAPDVAFASGATAGIPATWTPAGCIVPASQAAVIAGSPIVVKASPTSAWTTGQYAQTLTAGAAGRVYWNGTTWVAGAAP